MPQPQRSPLAWLWQNEELSDVRLQLRTCVNPPPTADHTSFMKQLWVWVVGGNTSSPSANVTEQQGDPSPSSSTDLTLGPTFPLHATVLASASQYFRTRLKKSRHVDNAAVQYADSDAGEPHGGGQACATLLVEHVEAGEVDAMEAVLRHCYTGELCKAGSKARALSCSMLLQMVVLSDRFDVPACLSHCYEELASRPASAFGYDVMDVLSALPARVRQLPWVVNNLQAIMERRLAALHDVEAVCQSWCVGSRNLYRELLLLSHAQLLRLLKGDEFRSHSENSVLLMADAWASSAAGTACTQAQLREITKALRLTQLTRTFMFDVLPKLAWTQLSAQELEFLLYYHSANPALQKDIVERKHCVGPAAWYSAPRAAPTLAHLNMQIEITKQELAWELYNLEYIKRTEAYYNGFVVALDLTYDTKFPVIELWVRVVCGGAAKREIPIRGAWSNATFSVVDAGERRTAVKQVHLHNKLGMSECARASGLQLTKIPYDERRGIASWAPYLKDDKFCAQCTVTECL